MTNDVALIMYHIILNCNYFEIMHLHLIYIYSHLFPLGVFIIQEQLKKKII